MPDPQRYTFPKAQRLGGRGTFKAIRDAGVREQRGPIVAHAVPNGLPHPRLGIGIGRHVGNAVRRNRIKRLLRESWRLMQHDWPRGYDVVLTVRPHQPLMLADYQRLLSGLMVRLHAGWGKRRTPG